MRYVLTPGGKRRLQHRLLTVRAEYDAVVADNPAALEAGDNSGWHDNFAFEENQRRMHQLAHRVRELERIHDQAEVVPPLRSAPERVVIGAAVTWAWLDEPEARPQQIWLAGYEDGDPALGRISYESPLGRVLIGAEEGESRELMQGGRQRPIEVLAIGPTPAGADEAELHGDAAPRATTLVRP